QPGKHGSNVHGDEGSRASRKYHTLVVGDLGYIDVLPALYLLRPPCHGQGCSKRYRLQVIHVHVTGEGHHVAELVDLAHGFIQDGGDNATVRMTGRPLITPCKFE